MAKVRLPQGGGCQCGGVRYTLTARPVMVAACHCTACQGHSASAFGLSVFVPRSGFTIGREALGYVTRTADSGRQIGCYFCTGCGTRIYHEPAPDSELVNLKPGTLDDTSWLHPVAHLWTDSAQPWVTIDPDALNFPGQPDSFAPIAERWAAYAKDLFEDG